MTADEEIAAWEEHYRLLYEQKLAGAKVSLAERLAHELSELSMTLDSDAPNLDMARHRTRRMLAHVRRMLPSASIA